MSKRWLKDSQLLLGMSCKGINLNVANKVIVKKMDVLRREE